MNSGLPPGLDAVELQFENGGTVRIGTDEPQRLQAAIVGAIVRDPFQE